MSSQSAPLPPAPLLLPCLLAPCSCLLAPTTADTVQSYWGNTFKGKYGGRGSIPVSFFDDSSVYKHAIVRDPVERLAAGEDGSAN